MIEFAILLPILMMLFLGMVEFGFMLNTYLSLLDATRQVARLYSNFTPFRLNTDTNTVEDDLSFYVNCATEVDNVLNPPDDPDARRFILDDTRDDILVSVMSVSVDTATSAITIQRHPDNGSLFYSMNGTQLSAYQDDTQIESLMIQNGTQPVETGILIVEIYYGYTGVLRIPWLGPMMSEENPLMLHASTIMPLVAAKP